MSAFGGHPGFAEALAGGFGALVGPGAILAAVVSVGAGLALSRRFHARDHLLGGAVLLFLFVSAVTRRGLVTPGLTESLIAAGALVLISFQLTQHRPRTRESLEIGALLSGFLVATVALQWRLDVYGPVLAAIRDGWQTEPRTAALFTYHLATGLGLTGLYLIATQIGQKIPSAISRGAFWGATVLVGAAVGLGFWPDLQRELVLHWPVVVLG